MRGERGISLTETAVVTAGVGLLGAQALRRPMTVTTAADHATLEYARSVLLSSVHLAHAKTTPCAGKNQALTLRSANGEPRRQDVPHHYL